MIKHEIAHFINEQLGHQKTGQAFSADLGFRAAVLEDCRIAKAMGYWPDIQKHSLATIDGGSLGHYFMGNLTPDGKPDEDQNFSEVFAEVTNHLLGGGYVDSYLIKGVYRYTTAYVNQMLDTHFPPSARPLAIEAPHWATALLQRMKKWFGF